jgi:ABC-type multidrug transport system ATPase subunit
MRDSGLFIEDLICRNLAPFSLDLDEGECVSLGGPSGSGKTSLLRAIADLDPNEGRVMLDGLSREAIAAPAWRRAVCYLPSNSGWWADRVGSHFPDADAARALLSALDLAGDALDWPVAQLSTGERQRLALARLLLVAPRVMLLDEPTSGLDQDTSALVEGILKQRLDAGVGILLVTHVPEQANRLAARHLRIEADKVAETTP